VNLYWVRPTLDYLFLNSMREVASPGFMRKTEAGGALSMGSTTSFPKSLRPFN
jgi:hypothetical protein